MKYTHLPIIIITVLSAIAPRLAVADAIVFKEGNNCTQDVVFRFTSDSFGGQYPYYNYTCADGNYPNDEARSVYLLNVRAGVRIRVFDNPHVKRYDDWTEIVVKRQVPRISINSFDRSYENSVVKVKAHRKDGLDGKVSCIGVRLPSRN
jgi:hypothetical protein